MSRTVIFCSALAALVVFWLAIPSVFIGYGNLEKEKKELHSFQNLADEIRQKEVYISDVGDGIEMLRKSSSPDEAVAGKIRTLSDSLMQACYKRERYVQEYNRLIGAKVASGQVSTQVLRNINYPYCE
jgi:hypothetical protein